MSPALKYWMATASGVAIFAIAMLVWLRSDPAVSPEIHVGAFAAAGLGYAIYVLAAWFGRCPDCRAWLWRDEIWSDIAPTCPACGRDRYEGPDIEIDLS